MEKTNEMRLLEAAEIYFEVRTYEVDEEDLSAAHAAEAAGLEADTVFKTIVLSGDRGGPFVCVIPGPCETDLKKTTKATAEFTDPI